MSGLIQPHEGTAVLHDANGPRTTFNPEISVDGNRALRNNDLDKMELPKITALQFAVLLFLTQRELTRVGTKGEEVRAHLEGLGIEEYEGPKFYMLMKRMAESGWISQSKKQTGPGRSKESYYKILTEGKRQLENAQQWYGGK